MLEVETPESPRANGGDRSGDSDRCREKPFKGGEIARGREGHRDVGPEAQGRSKCVHEQEGFHPTELTMNTRSVTARTMVITASRNAVETAYPDMGSNEITTLAARNARPGTLATTTVALSTLARFHDPLT